MKNKKTTVRGCIAAMFALAFAATSAFAGWEPVSTWFNQNATTFSAKDAEGAVAEGSWSATSNDGMTLDDLAYVEDGKIVIDAVKDAGEEVSFTPSNAVAVCDQFVITNHVNFSAAYTGMSGESATGKAGILLEKNSLDDKIYFTTIVEGNWQMSEVEADPTQDYVITFTFNKGDGVDGTVTYSYIDPVTGAPEYIDESAWDPTDAVEKVSVCGSGTITALAAATEESFNYITLPANPTGIESVAVKVGGSAIPLVGGRYKVATGSNVVIEFTASAGYIVKIDGVQGNQLPIDGIDDDVDLSAGYDDVDVVQAEASIDGTLYETLDEAIAEAVDGDTIDMLVDVTATDVEVPAGVTLDLGGNTLTYDSITNNGAVVFYTGAEFTTFNQLDGTWVFGAELVIDDGELEPSVLYTYPMGTAYTVDTTTGAIVIDVPERATYVNNYGFDAGADVTINGSAALAGAIAGSCDITVNGALALDTITIGEVGDPAVLTFVSSSGLGIDIAEFAEITLVPDGDGKIITNTTIDDDTQFTKPEDYYSLVEGTEGLYNSYIIADATVAMIDTDRYTDVDEAILDATDAAESSGESVQIDIVADAASDYYTYPNGTTITVAADGSQSFDVPADAEIIIGYDPDVDISVDGDVVLEDGVTLATAFSVTAGSTLTLGSITVDDGAEILSLGTIAISAGDTVAIAETGKIASANQISTLSLTAPEGYSVVEKLNALSELYEYTVEEDAETVTMTVSLGSGIASLTVDGVAVVDGGTVASLTPGDTVEVELTASSGITIPLFKLDGSAISSTADVTVPNASGTWAFTVTEADASGATDEEIVDAIIESMDDATASEKVYSLTNGSNAASIASWIKAGVAAGTISSALLADAVAVDLSYNLGTTTLFSTTPDMTVTSMQTVAAGEASNTGYQLVFSVKNGTSGSAVQPADTEAVRNYVKTLFKCSTSLTFGSGTEVDVEPTISISGTSITANVEIPKTTGQAFMKFEK